TIHIVEVLLAISSIISNCISTVVTHNAVPLPYPQRRMLASVSLNFVILAVYQFARNLFLGVTMYEPCITMMNTITCKLHEFPLLFCYIHGSAAICVVAIQTTIHIGTFQWTTTSSVRQSALILICIAATLVLTTLDHDVEPQNMSQCSILMAFRDRDLVFCLLTMLILLHTAAAATVTMAARRRTNRVTLVSHMTLSLKDVITVETLLWHCSLLFSGCFVLYRHVIADFCDECVMIALEVSFNILPLGIAFFHPMMIIWFVFPIRDAAIRACPRLRLVLPEYAMVPPPPVRLFTRQSNAEVEAVFRGADLDPLQPSKAVIPETNNEVAKSG
uniref:DUF1980 domain-containing protein n=1 Tax=Haemonchus contortus TaxID=6289 RepID=A0A7I4Z4F1_HAECO